MIQDGRRNVPSIQTGICAWSASIEKTVTPTFTPMKKIRKRKNTRVPTITIDDLIAKDSMGLVQMETIVSIRTNVVMTKVERTTNIKSCAKNTVNNPRIKNDFIITGMNK